MTDAAKLRSGTIPGTCARRNAPATSTSSSGSTARRSPTAPSTISAPATIITSASNARSESRRNSVFGITAAPQEYQKYIELAIARPEVLRYYNAVFGDIYLLNEKLLPVFDVVTLFHLCEFRGETDRRLWRG